MLEMVLVGDLRLDEKRVVVLEKFISVLVCQKRKIRKGKSVSSYGRKRKDVC